MKTLRVISSLLGWALASPIVSAAEFVDPPVFTSDASSKTLDLLMVAKPAPIGAIPGVTGWAYEICARQYTNSTGDGCLPGMANPNPYGGSRLQLNPGDTLKVHLVNRLPLINEAKHQDDPGEAFLVQNPTNLHTHGMLVSPNLPLSTALNPIFGDTVFVLGFNSANGTPDITPTSHIHGDVRMDTIDYQIPIPAGHPSGLFWFHPHAHGIALNQVSAGLSGIITIGQVKDYIHNLPANINTRHLILKDTQVSNNQLLSDQEDPALCATSTSAPGSCTPPDGSQWFFTLSGQLNPTITVNSAGEIWRITNASASVTYELQLTKSNNGIAASANSMALQVLSIDGISVTPTTGISLGDLKTIGGAKFRPITCPGVSSANPATVCASSLHMMPSSRAEVWVVNRDAGGNAIKADGSQAIFQTVGYATGPAGDNWPAITLAQVSFSGGGAVKKTPTLKVAASGLDYNQIATQLTAANAAVAPNTACKPLPAGWKRRIFYGYPLSTNFGLGFELIDDKGHTVPGSFQDVAAFPNAAKTVCLPLGSGNTPVYEHWELINLTGEDHNFHIHQTKFRVLTKGEVVGLGSGVPTRGILQDNVPLPSGSAGCDGTVASWRNKACQSTRTDVEIPFAIAGDFVFHCHILEHEDGGMMATIHVVGAAN